jgi:hypothetical protein
MDEFMKAKVKKRKAKVNRSLATVDNPKMYQVQVEDIPTP